MNSVNKSPTQTTIDKIIHDISYTNNEAFHLENDLCGDGYFWTKEDYYNVKTLLSEISSIRHKMAETAIKSYLYSKYGHKLPKFKIKDWVINSDNIDPVFTDFDCNYNDAGLLQAAYYEKGYIFDAITAGIEDALDTLRIECERQKTLHVNHSEYDEGCLECESEFIEDTLELNSNNLEFRNSVL